MYWPVEWGTRCSHLDDVFDQFRRRRTSSARHAPDLGASRSHDTSHSVLSRVRVFLDSEIPRTGDSLRVLGEATCKQEGRKCPPPWMAGANLLIMPTARPPPRSPMGVPLPCRAAYPKSGYQFRLCMPSIHMPLSPSPRSIMDHTSSM